MKNISIGNLIKKLLVKMLIINRKKIPLKLKRELIFKNNEIKIIDIITKNNGYNIIKLSFGSPFNSIHMASSKYYPNNFKHSTINFKRATVNKYT